MSQTSDNCLVTQVTTFHLLKAKSHEDVELVACMLPGHQLRARCLCASQAFGRTKDLARLRNPGLKLLPVILVNTATVHSLPEGWRGQEHLLPLTLWKRRKRPVAELHLEVRAQPGTEVFLGYCSHKLYYHTYIGPRLQAIVEVLL